MLSRLILVVRRRLALLVLLPLLGAATALALAPRGPAVAEPVHAATALVAADQSVLTDTEVQQALVQATEGEVARDVAEVLGGGTSARDVGRAVDAELDPESFVITITATAPAPARAEQLAATFADAFVAVGNAGLSADVRDAIAQAEADVAAAQEQLDALVEAGDPDGAAEVARAEAALGSAELAAEEVRGVVRPSDVYEPISVGPATPVASTRLDVLSHTPLRVALGGLLGLLAAVGVVVAVERSNPRIDDIAQAEAIVGAPVLSLVPQLGRRRRALLERADPEVFRGPFAESFRTLRSTIEFRAATVSPGRTPRLMVTSATPGEGKTTTVAFLALAFSQSGQDPVVIGGDLRRPTIHRAFGLPSTPGLSSRHLGDAHPLHELLVTDPVTGVTLMPSGPACEEVAPVIADVIEVGEAARSCGRPLLLDTAPVRVANDAVAMLPAVDGVVVVVRVGRSTVRTVAQMVQALRLNDADILGVVVVGAPEAAESARYYDAYYRVDEPAPRPGPAAAARPTGTGAVNAVTVDLATPPAPPAPDPGALVGSHR